MKLMDLFSNSKVVVGMIHVQALPGTPRHQQPLAEISATAEAEARALAAAGVDGLLIENMHDLPYLCGTVGPEIIAGMTAVGAAVRRASDLPLGVQILAAANREALAAAQGCGAKFVRVENFAYAHVADEGLMPTAEAGPLLRYRKQIGADDIAIIADVKKKHSSHALTADVSLAEAALTTQFVGADGLVVTGTATGQPTAVDDVRTVRQAVQVPVCIGSGLTPENLPSLWPYADVFIVGSYLKVDGVWSNALDGDRTRKFMETAQRLRAAD